MVSVIIILFLWRTVAQTVPQTSKLRWGIVTHSSLSSKFLKWEKPWQLLFYLFTNLIIWSLQEVRRMGIEFWRRHLNKLIEIIRPFTKFMMKLVNAVATSGSCNMTILKAYIYAWMKDILIFQLKYQMNTNCNDKDMHTLEYLNNKGRLE